MFPKWIHEEEKRSEWEKNVYGWTSVRLEGVWLCCISYDSFSLFIKMICLYTNLPNKKCSINSRTIENRATFFLLTLLWCSDPNEKERKILFFFQKSCFKWTYLNLGRINEKEETKKKVFTIRPYEFQCWKLNNRIIRPIEITNSNWKRNK